MNEMKKHKIELEKKKSLGKNGMGRKLDVKFNENGPNKHDNDNYLIKRNQLNFYLHKNPLNGSISLVFLMPQFLIFPDSKTTIEIPTPKAAETQQEHVKFAHAPEIAGNSQKAVRIQSETQEEAPVAVKNLSANKMNDQVSLFFDFRYSDIPVHNNSGNSIGTLLRFFEKL